MYSSFILTRPLQNTCHNFFSHIFVSKSMHIKRFYCQGSKLSGLIWSRNIVRFVRNALGLEPKQSLDGPQESNRFHPWEESPCPDLRKRVMRIKKLVRCPVTEKDIRYTCPLSGIQTNHSKEAWEIDKNYHQNKIYEKIKES